MNSTTARLSKLLLGIATTLIFFAPALANAQIRITEIMYDTPGADSGREWIEITNVGAEPAPISAYVLTESSTNHKIKSVSGSSVLLPNTSAIIADNPAKFLGDWPTYTGALFDSTFALSNDGESLSIKLSSTSLATSADDSIAYDTSVGASGDTESLHRVGDSFVPALPNPGMYPGTLSRVQKVVPVVAVKTSAKTSPKSTAKKSSDGESANNTASPSQIYSKPSSVSQNTEITGVPPLLLWILGLGCILVLGVAAAFFARVSEGKKGTTLSETNTTADEFELVEN